jgi:hypothetical protein
LVGAVHDETKIHGVVRECADWWEENCLYLESEVRHSFYSSLLGAPLHRDLLRAKDMASVKENWKTIMKPGELILSTFDLVSIVGVEREVPVPTNDEEGKP